MLSDNLVGPPFDEVLQLSVPLYQGTFRLAIACAIEQYISSS
jgi:hypothetical protein